MPPRKRTPAPPADPLRDLKVEVYAGLGETSLKAECTLGVAAEVAARLHAELERLGTLKPSVLPKADSVPAGTLFVGDDETDSARRRLGF